MNAFEELHSALRYHIVNTLQWSSLRPTQLEAIRPVQNAAGIGNGKCPLPDLTVDARLLRASLGYGPMSFSTSSCEAREACGGGVVDICDL